MDNSVGATLAVARRETLDAAAGEGLAPPVLSQGRLSATRKANLP